MTMAPEAGAQAAEVEAGPHLRQSASRENGALAMLDRPGGLPSLAKAPEIVD